MKQPIPTYTFDFTQTHCRRKHPGDRASLQAMVVSRTHDGILYRVKTPHFDRVFHTTDAGYFDREFSPC